MSTTQPSQSSTSPLDTSVMPTLHTFHRREFRLAGGVVRGVAAGDLRRAAVVADHVEFLTRHLHHHHTIEDELMWPKLLERVPEELAPIVHLMESQHARVDGLIQEIAVVLPSFRETAGTEPRDRLADLLDTLHVHLVEHLDAEEQRLLPIAARTMTQAEWDAMGEAGRASTPRKEMALAFGMYQYEGDPAVITEMLAPAPLPVRVLVPRLARRAFRKYAERVHGTPTP
jgi:hemerythrin-like domain-containing protein